MMPPLLFLVTTITLTGMTDQSLVEPSSGCPRQCTCAIDSGTYRTTVHCDQGGINDHKLGNLLGDIRRDVQSICIVGPDDQLDKHPNRFSWTMDFGKFGSLNELHLPNNGIVGLGKGAFRRLPKLLWLDLSHNKISFVDVSTFFGADSLEHLDLSANTLNVGGLTSGTFKHLNMLRWLSLANNNITEAPRGLFGGGPLLETLDLSGNRLTVDAIRDLLSDAPYLMHLSLANCGLTDLPQEIFSSVPRLQRLNLGGNNLGGIPTLALLPLRQLSSLELHSNGITQIPEHALYGVNVFELDLSHNLLGLCYGDVSDGRQTYKTNGVDARAFWGSNLSTIDLSHNKYSEFDAALLGDAQKTVKILKLNGNPLRILDVKQTTGMQLTALHMSDCNLKSIPAHLPPSLRDLIVLNVSHNQLTSLTSDVINQSPLIRVIDVSYNMIREIAATTLKLVDYNLDTLLIEGNPLDCHCHVMPLQAYLRKQQIKQHQSPTQVSNTHCASPSQFTGIPVTSISTPPDCAVLFGASSGLTQKSELGILGAMATIACLVIGIIIVFIYVARTWRRKGVYHTRELHGSHTNLSSNSSHDQYDSGKRHQRHVFVPHPGSVKDGAHERLF